jgi:hypothetical protein
MPLFAAGSGGYSSRITGTTYIIKSSPPNPDRAPSLSSIDFHLIKRVNPDGGGSNPSMGIRFFCLFLMFFRGDIIFLFMFRRILSYLTALLCSVLRYFSLSYIYKCI